MLRILAATVLLLATLVGAGGLAAGALLSPAIAPAYREGSAAGGTLALRSGLPFIELVGTPAERGRQSGLLAGTQATDLLAIMGLNPAPTVAGTHLAGCIAAIAPEDRAELAELAAASGLPLERLLTANATVEAMCSAVVRIRPDGSPVVARNMDFFPPAALGPSTVIAVVREPGRHGYAAVTWPGMVGVISGMNDAGLSACVLLNWRGARLPAGEPLALRVRRLLQDADGVEAALAVLRRSPVGSRHYVLLADRHGAALAWWTPDGVHVDRPTAGWLVATNLPRTAAGIPVDDDLRGNCLARAIARLDGAEPDGAWFRRVLTASYMPGDNAQAMVFDPLVRRLELALAGDGVAAARGPWRTVGLGAILDGAAVGTARVGREAPARPAHHYLLGGGD